MSGVGQPVTHDVAVRGPGDVIGISASQVVRTDPIDGAVGVEPNYFAQIEFDRPDLPWLFTPAAAVGERLRPWIVLVVVDAEGASGVRRPAGIAAAGAERFGQGGERACPISPTRIFGRTRRRSCRTG